MSSLMIPPIETGIPFIGVLLSIAFCPLLIPRIWHKYESLILSIWVILSTWLCFVQIGSVNTENIIAGVLIKEYIPFITLIATLFTISNGINIQLHCKGTTKANVCILFIGEVLANFIGTTGTAILLLRPLLNVNQDRAYKVHTVIFFIFLVSNIGGCLLPFGDPPLFLGYLKGVNFFWTLTHIFPLFVLVSASLLLIYAGLDTYLMRKEMRNKGITAKEGESTGDLFSSTLLQPTAPNSLQNPTQEKLSLFNMFRFEGKINLFLLFLVVITVAGTGVLPKGEAFSCCDVKVHWRNLLRDGLLILFSFLSLVVGKKKDKPKDFLSNISHISWGPLTEVMRYFLAIFITMAPVALMLKGGEGIFSCLKDFLMRADHASFLYFWFVAPFSAFLDNAPTYVIFFKMAGGNAEVLMTEGVKILTAISASSVFMGAMTYIGNAPNFMVLSISKQYGIKMPGFLGYMGWSCLILLPIFLLFTYLFLY